jgi:serine/threonine protein kinase
LQDNVIAYVDTFLSPNPVLIMELATAGNLSHHKVLPFESVVVVTFQISNALTHLHALGITHRDIKPENILLARDRPLKVKLSDFGLSTSTDEMRTFCGTELYLAPEVTEPKLREKRYYTSAVDIWAVGAIGERFTCGFPSNEPQPKFEDPKGCNRWCEAVSRQAQKGPFAPYLVKMLCISPVDRLSARQLRDELRIQYFNENSSQSEDTRFSTAETSQMLGGVQKCERKRLTPLGEAEEDSTASTVLLAQLWDRIDPDFDGRSKQVDSRETQHSSSDPTQRTSTSPYSGSQQKRRRTEKLHSRLGDRQRTQKEAVSSQFGSPTGISTDLTKTMSCVSKLAKDTRQPAKGHGSFASTSTLNGQRIGVRPDEGDKVPHKGPKRPFNGNSQLSSPAVPQEVDNDLPLEICAANNDYLYLAVGEKEVHIRKSDCSLNATQILDLTGKSRKQRRDMLNMMKLYTEIELHKPEPGFPFNTSWVSFEHGLLLCEALGLTATLEPLLKFGFKCGNPHSQQPNYLLYRQIFTSSGTVSVFEPDGWINVTPILRAAGRQLKQFLDINPKLQSRVVVKGPRWLHGTYMEFDIGLQLCKYYHLDDLHAALSAFTDKPAEPTQPGPFIESDVPEIERILPTKDADLKVLREAYQKNKNPTENELRGIVVQTSKEMHQVLVRTPFHDNEETKNKAEVVRKSKIPRSTKD